MQAFEHYSLGKQRASLNHQGMMTKIFALPAYHWVVLTGILVLIPHLATLPAWLSVLAMVSLLAQKPAIKQRMARTLPLQKAQRVIKLLVLFFGMGAIYAQYGKLLGVDVAVGFLVLCFCVKAWELYAKRDAYVLLNLGLFVLGSAFLMSQSLSVVILGLPALMASMMSFIALSDETNDTGQGRLRSLMMLTLPAIPILLVLFVFFPRLPPLWSLPMAGKNATTGISDSMSPGDFSNLSQSTKLAFRAEFEGKIPSRQSLYWRGLVLSNFDGTTWTQSDLTQGFWSSSDINSPPEWIKSVPVGQPTPYKVILEPTEQHWLFALDYPMLYPKKGLGLSGEFVLRSHMPVSVQLQYQSAYYPHSQIDLELGDLQRRVNVRLPKEGNPQSHAFAQALFNDSGQDPKRYINAIQRHISTGGFSYTLSPPLLQKERIDEFLFGTKAGFCEHYASSFTFLMRAVGIPARVVAGYQGGELGRDGQSWEVRQMDAHAWSEVWLEGEGWVRIDPTAFVASDRIDDGMGALTDAGGAEMFGEGIAGQWGYQQFRLLQTLRRYSDQMSYYFQKQVVGYDQDKQKSSLFRWFNIKSFVMQFVVLAGLLVLLVGLFLVFMWYKRKKRHHPLDAMLFKLSARLAKADPSLAYEDSEPYLSWLDRVSAKMGQTEHIEELKRLYRSIRYGQGTMDKQTMARFAVLIKAIKHKKPTNP